MEGKAALPPARGIRLQGLLFAVIATLTLIAIAAHFRWNTVFTFPGAADTPASGTAFVDVVGEFKTPQSVPYTSGLTVESAIRKAGGFTAYADQKRVRLSRSGTTAIINVRSLRSNPLKDIRLAPGDQITASPGCIW